MENIHNKAPNEEPLLSNILNEEKSRFALGASWYHVLDIGDGIYTRGIYDHTSSLSKYGFPDSLKEKTVLDVGCADGFFAFEFEKRGAKEVLAIDTNRFDGEPAISPSQSKIKQYRNKYQKMYSQNNQFISLAHRLGLEKVSLILMVKKIIKSNINFRYQSIYELRKEEEKFDFVFCGDLIEHLNNPLEAVEQLRAVTKDTCIISLSNPLKLPLLLRWINCVPRLKNRLVTYHGDSGGTFFHFYPQTFTRVLLAAGFASVQIYSTFMLENKKYGQKIPKVVYHCRV